ncbi:MAG: membrane protein insertase YidC [Ruminococcaceae bacterium]|nr:membrane protein insertase YidC [Oscillospiraceae bacterium]
MFAQLGYYICIPFAALTRLFYTWTGSYGVALILFTLVIKLVMLPFQLKSKKSMLRMNRMSGKIKDIQVRYANNKERQQQEIADMYAREGVNPMSGCLWSFLPFPILIALYNVIRYPLRYFMTLSEETVEQIAQLATSLGYKAPTSGTEVAYAQINLAEFIHQNWASFEGKFEGLIDLNYSFLGMDLSAIAKDGFSQFPGGGWAVWGLLLMPIIAAAIQFFMSLRSMKNSSSADANGSMKTMMYMMPLMTLWIGYSMPSALCVYWIAQSAFSLLQEVILDKYFNKILDREETDKEREKREKRIAKYEKQKELMAQQRGDMKVSEKKPQNKKKAGGEKKQPGTNENGRVGNRPYARGRAFSEDHYAD